MGGGGVRRKACSMKYRPAIGSTERARELRTNMTDAERAKWAQHREETEVAATPADKRRAAAAERRRRRRATRTTPEGAMTVAPAIVGVNRRRASAYGACSSFLCCSSCARSSLALRCSSPRSSSSFETSGTSGRSCSRSSSMLQALSSRSPPSSTPPAPTLASPPSSTAREGRSPGHRR